MFIEDTVCVECGGTWTVRRQLDTTKEEIDKLWIDKLTPIKADALRVISALTGKEAILLCRMHAHDKLGDWNDMDIVWRGFADEATLRVIGVSREWPVKDTLLCAA